MKSYSAWRLVLIAGSTSLIFDFLAASLHFQSGLHFFGSQFTLQEKIARFVLWCCCWSGCHQAIKILPALWDVIKSPPRLQETAGDHPAKPIVLAPLPVAVAAINPVRLNVFKAESGEL